MRNFCWGLSGQGAGKVKSFFAKTASAASIGDFVGRNMRGWHSCSMNGGLLGKVAGDVREMRAVGGLCVRYAGLLVWAALRGLGLRAGGVVS